MYRGNFASFHSHKRINFFFLNDNEVYLYLENIQVFELIIIIVFTFRKPSALRGVCSFIYVYFNDKRMRVRVGKEAKKIGGEVH